MLSVLTLPLPWKIFMPSTDEPHALDSLPHPWEGERTRPEELVTLDSRSKAVRHDGPSSARKTFQSTTLLIFRELCHKTVVLRRRWDFNSGRPLLRGKSGCFPKHFNLSERRWRFNALVTKHSQCVVPKLHYFRRRMGKYFRHYKLWTYLRSESSSCSCLLQIIRLFPQ